MQADLRVLETETTVPIPIEAVFEFFSRAENLQTITPPSLGFQILSPLPIEMGEGTLIDYRLRLMGVPFRWKTRIEAWEPPFRFVDSQLKGPYRLWVHEHSFREADVGTVMRDRVEYLAPGGPLEPLIQRLFVGPQVQRIFGYRSRAIQELMADARVYT